MSVNVRHHLPVARNSSIPLLILAICHGLLMGNIGILQNLVEFRGGLTCSGVLLHYPSIPLNSTRDYYYFVQRARDAVILLEITHNLCFPWKFGIFQ